ncbi:hypothetical protein SNN83_001523 [Cronobacter malonaticus]|nr:hypothetical protein [Cronobacter malonaticus]
MSKPKSRFSARFLKRKEADAAVIQKMDEAFQQTLQKVKQCEYEMTENIINMPFYRTR